MKRRDFLKLIGIAPIAPSVLVALPKKELTVAREFVSETVASKPTILNWMRKIIDESSFQTSHIFVSSKTEERLTAALKKYCRCPVSPGGFKRNIIFFSIPIFVCSLCKDDEIILINGFVGQPFYIEG